MLRVALHGRSGAGKSTTSGLLIDALGRQGLKVAVVKLAEPLYDVQRMVYSLCGRPMADTYQQDGILLRALADSFRRIDDDSLTRLFAARVAHAAAAGFTAVVCDDMRKPDHAALAAAGFRIVRVVAGEHIRLRRRAERGDLAPSDDNHATEGPIASAEYEIRNDGTFTELADKVGGLAGLLCASERRDG